MNMYTREPGYPLKNKYMIRDKKGERVRTYADVGCTGNSSNEREK